MYLSKITHNPKVLKRYSQFESKLELKQSVRKHIKKIKAQDMRADRKQGLIDVTMLLFSMSKKIIGVSWMCYKTMAKRLKVSDKTIQRRIDQLVELGIIGKMSARRSSDKMRTSNVLYFVKCPNMNSSSFYSKKNLNDIEHKQKDKQNKFCNMIPKHSVENIYHFFKTKAELIGVIRNIDFCFKKSGYELNTYEQKIAIIKALHVLKSTKKL